MPKKKKKRLNEWKLGMYIIQNKAPVQRSPRWEKKEIETVGKQDLP